MSTIPSEQQSGLIFHAAQVGTPVVGEHQRERGRGAAGTSFATIDEFVRVIYLLCPP